MKVTLAICTNRGVRPKTVESLLKLVAYDKQTDFHIILAERGYTVAENRNYSVIQAQRNGSDYLAFWDDDMIFPENTLEKLLALKKDIVGVNSYSRCLPLSSTVGLMDKDGNYKHPNKYPSWEMKIPDEPFQAFFVGCGICLIDMKVFEKLKKPYFAFETYKTGELKGMISNGEDGVFCREARKAGFEVWVDPTIGVGHLGEFEFGLAKEKEIKEIYVPSL